MKYLITDLDNNIIKECKDYPGKNIESLPIGFEVDKYKIHIIVNIPINYDPNFQRFEKDKGYIFTEDVYLDNSHIFICHPKYNIIDSTPQQVIQTLNKSLGEFLDIEYPLWERAKHAGEGNYILWSKSEGDLTIEELARKKYIDDTYTWISNCRKERDNKENEFLTNGTLPSLDWEARPIK
jgi:hypothetical protein